MPRAAAQFDLRRPVAHLQAPHSVAWLLRHRPVSLAGQGDLGGSLPVAAAQEEQHQEQHRTTLQPEPRVQRLQQRSTERPPRPTDFGVATTLSKEFFNCSPD